MLNLTCLCGRIAIETKTKPEYINACNCAFCSKSGAYWGYFDPADVRIVGDARAYRREDKDDPAAQLHFCATCGSATHFVLTESTIAKIGNVMMGVNMRLADEADLAGIELRYPDGRGWPGHGAFGFVRAASIIGDAAGAGA